MIRRKFKKNKKIALMASILAFSVMSVTGYGIFNNINAATNGNIPEVNAYQNGNHAKVELGIDVADKDILYKDSFDNTNAINLGGGSHGKTGNQSISTAEKYSGSGSVQIIDTMTNKTGNEYWIDWGNTCSDKSYFSFKNPLKVPNGSKIRASYKAKAVGGNHSEISINNDTVTRTYRGNPAWDLKYAQNVNFCNVPREIAVQPSNAPDGSSISVVTTKNGNSGRYDAIPYRYDKANNKLVILYEPNVGRNDSDSTTSFVTGDAVLSYVWVSSGYDRNLPVDNTWHTYSGNYTIIDDKSLYDFGVDGMLQDVHTRTNGVVYIDDFKLGYASQAKIFRDGTLVHTGYESDFEDTSATDKAKPNKSSNVGVSRSGNNINISWGASSDNGTTYNYTASSISNQTNTESAKSSAKAVTINSGIKGYRVDIDNNPNTVCTNTTALTSETSMTHEVDANNHYVHIAAVDNEGNISDTVTQSFDVTAPQVDITYDKSNLTNGWSKKDINLTINATDDFSGVKNTTLPDGSVVNGATANYTVTAEGTYTFKSEDNSGNVATKTFKVGGDNSEFKIDKTAPIITVEYNHADGWTNEDIVATITATDSESGVKSIILPDETKIDGNKASLTISEDGTYTVMAEDNAGNIQYYDITVDKDAGDMKIDKKAPSLTLTTDKPNGWVKDSINIIAKASDTDSDVDYIVLPDGTRVNDSTARYSVSKGGTYKFQTFDRAGNMTEKSIDIGLDSSELKFDNTAPTIKIDANTSDWTSESLPIKITATDTESGVKAIITPDNVEHEGNSYTFNADINGTYTFTAVDNVGNESTQSITISKIDRDKPNTPSIGVISAGDKWINTDYHPSITATDGTVSGIKEIQYKVVNKTTDEVVKDWSTYDDNTMISSEGDLEVHYRVISNSNVASDDSNFELKIDKTNPSITLDYTNPTEWNPDGVAIHFTASDSLSGVKEVVLPDGKRVNLTNGTFMAMKNGEYEFTVIDNAGNSFKQVATIKNVDTDTPTMPEITNGTHTGGGTDDGDDSSADKNTIGWLNHDYLPSLKVESNNDSGIKEIKYRISDKATGKLIKDWDTYREDVTTIDEEGISKVDFKVISNSGKESEVLETTVKIDKTNPEFKAENITPATSLARKVKYNLLANDTISGVNSITLSDGSKVVSDKATVDFDKAGTYEAMAIDNATNSEKVKIIIPEGVNENANKAVTDLSKILEEYKPTNNSSEEELKQFIRDKLPDYDVTIDNFSKRDATEDATGNLTANVTIKDSDGNSITDSLNKTISKLPQSVETVKSEMEKILLDFKATNDTEAIDILKKVSRVIKNPNIFPTIENFHKDKATIDKSGIITGTLILKDNKGHSDSINLNLPIDKLIQTVEDAKNRLKDNLSDIKFTNDTTKEDIIEQVRKFVVNPDISIDIDDLKIDKATETKEGKGSCTVILKDKSGNSAEIPIEAVIDKLPQTLDGLLDLINSHLKDIPATNSTTADDIIDYLNQYITNSKLTIKLDDFNKDVATIYGNGNIKGLITVVDSETGKEESTNLDLTINKLESNSSEDDKKDYYENKDYNSKEDNPSNNNPSSIGDVIEDLSDLATGKTSVQELPKTEGIGIISVGVSVFELLGVGIYMVIRKFKRK